MLAVQALSASSRQLAATYVLAGALRLVLIPLPSLSCLLLL